MGSFTASIPLNIRLPGGFEAVGPAGTVFSIPDELDAEFARDQAPSIPGFAWFSVATGRIPRPLYANLDGPTILAGENLPTSSDLIGVNIPVKVSGDFTGIQGVDGAVAFGASIWAFDGTAADDGKALTEYTALITAVGLYHAAEEWQVVRGATFQSMAWGAASGGHIGIYEGVRAGAFVYSAADSAKWTIDLSRNLIVEAPDPNATVGFAIYTEGGPSRLTGRLDVMGALALGDAGSGVLYSSLRSGTGSPQGAISGSAGDIYFRTDTPTSSLQRIYVCTGTTNWTGIA